MRLKRDVGAREPLACTLGNFRKFERGRWMCNSEETYRISAKADSVCLEKGSRGFRPWLPGCGKQVHGGSTCTESRAATLEPLLFLRSAQSQVVLYCASRSAVTDMQGRAFAKAVMNRRVVFESCASKQAWAQGVVAMRWLKQMFKISGPSHNGFAVYVAHCECLRSTCFCVWK